MNVALSRAMITSTLKISKLRKMGLTEPTLRRVAYSICTILSAKGPLKVSRIQDFTKYGRATVVFSIGWLVGQGVVILRGRMDDYEVQLAVQHRTPRDERG